ncbi:MAG: LysR family transcriptional regulator [Pseudomonadota bacterium]
MALYDAEDLTAFSMIYEAGGISSAERSSGRSKASLSRALSRLEAAAECLLFERVSSGLRPTEIGRALFVQASAVRTACEEADTVLRGATGAPAGRLTVAASATASQLLIAPALAAYKLQHPEVEITLRSTTEAPDPKGADIDLVMRAGWPSEQYLLARRIISGTTGLYVDAAGLGSDASTTIADLRRAGRIVIDAPDAPTEWCHAWTLERAGETLVLDAPPYMRIAEPSVVLTILAAGSGVALLPHFYAKQYVSAGTLRRVLPDWEGPSLELYAALPEGRTRIPAVRAFLDTLIEYARGLKLSE